MLASYTITTLASGVADRVVSAVDCAGQLAADDKGCEGHDCIAASMAARTLSKSSGSTLIIFIH